MRKQCRSAGIGRHFCFGGQNQTVIANKLNAAWIYRGRQYLVLARFCGGWSIMALVFHYDVTDEEIDRELRKALK